MSDTLNDLFDRSAAAWPDRVALVDGDRHTSYRELADAVSARARALVAAGVRPGSRVGLIFDRGGAQLTSLLAILRCGASYVPIDPTYPSDRRSYILTDAGLSHALVGPGLELVVDQSGVLALHWDELPAGPAEVELPIVPAGAEAYVIYTSGSTGAPKGCLVSHANVVALIQATLPLFTFDEQDRWTLFHSCNFDFSVWEMWGAWTTGAALCTVPAVVAAIPQDFAELLVGAGITVLNQVPSVFRQVAAAAVAAGGPLGLRYVVFGGEAVDLADVRDFAASGAAAGCEFINMYGITETTVHVTFKRLDPAGQPDLASSPIGRPLPHLSVTLRDADGTEVANGGAGEVFVAGAGVALGYLDRPELTAARFVEIDGVRHYRSGDLARLGSDGELYYLGRNDQQLKHRGYRIEAGEIETAIRGSGLASDAAVSLVRNSRGIPQLVACCVAGSVPLDTAAVREELRRWLPAYMVPDRLVAVDALPLTPSGKLDRQAVAAQAVLALASGRRSSRNLA